MVIGPSPGPAPAAHAREQLLGEPVELADMPEGEGAQEGPQGGGGHDPVAQHSGGLSAAQQVGVVDAVPTRQQRVDQGQQLAAGPVRASPLAQVDDRIVGAGRSRAAQPAWPAAAGPALAMAWVSSKQMSSWSRVWEDPIEKAPS